MPPSCPWNIDNNPCSSLTKQSPHPFPTLTPCPLPLSQVYGGPDMSAPRLAQLCTTTSTPLQVSSTGNLITVRFKSDDYVSGRGFNASWAELQGGG